MTLVVSRTYLFLADQNIVCFSESARDVMFPEIDGNDDDEDDDDEVTR